MHNGQADPTQVAQQASTADVVILVEATASALSALKAFKWGVRFPYSVGDVPGSISDTVIYSRFPLTDTAALPGTSFQQYVTTASAPGIPDLRIIAAHPCNPYCGRGLWATEHAVLQSSVEENLDQPLMVVGDLNAVNDHGPMRALRRAGMKSATDLVGAGWLPTYPANRRVPPLLPIDHVLLNDQADGDIDLDGPHRGDGPPRIGGRCRRGQASRRSTGTMLTNLGARTMTFATSRPAKARTTPSSARASERSSASPMVGGTCRRARTLPCTWTTQVTASVTSRAGSTAGQAALATDG